MAEQFNLKPESKEKVENFVVWSCAINQCGDQYKQELEDFNKTSGSFACPCCSQFLSVEKVNSDDPRLKSLEQVK